MSFDVFQYNKPLTVIGPDGFLYAFVMNRFMTNASTPINFKDDVSEIIDQLKQKSWLTFYKYRLDGGIVLSRKVVPFVVEHDFEQNTHSYELMFEVINPTLAEIQGTDCISIMFWTNANSIMNEYDSSKICVYDSATNSFVNQTTGEVASDIHSYLCQAIIQWRTVNNVYFPLVSSIKLMDHTLNKPMMDVGGESGDTYNGYFKLVMGEGVQGGGGSVSPEKDNSIVIEPDPDDSDSSSSGDLPWVFNLHGCGVVTFCNGVWSVEPVGSCDESDSSESSGSGESSSSVSSSSSSSISQSSSSSGESSSSTSMSSSSSSESEDYGTVVGVVDGVNPSRTTCGYVSYGENLIPVPRAFFRVQGGEYVWVEWNDKKALVNCGTTIDHQTGYWHWELLGRVILVNEILKPVQEHHGMISTPFSRQSIFTIIKNNLTKLFS